MPRPLRMIPFPGYGRTWENVSKLGGKKWTCRYCGSDVGSDVGYDTTEHQARIYICPSCTRPTYFFGMSEQVPGEPYGREVKNLPDDIRRLYNEARDCMTVESYTCAVLAARKILMHVGVEKGAEEGLKFWRYVAYLHGEGYIPPNARGWVDRIRDRGNEANHEISVMNRHDAEDVLSLVEMLLLVVYEYPNRE